MKQASPGRSPAVLLAAAVLVAAVAGTAVAGPDATTSVNKKQTKKISKKQAKKYFNNNIGGASVASAQTANTANSATTASSANPIAFARVADNGSVFGAQSKGVTSANVSALGAGVYCLRNLGFAFKGAMVTIDYETSPDFYDVAQFATGDPFGDCSGVGGTQAEVSTANANTGAFDDAGFYISFFN